MTRFLYRVFDDQSVSRLDEVDGFVAGNPNGGFSRKQYWAKYVIQRHMHWGNRRPMHASLQNLASTKKMYLTNRIEKLERWTSQISPRSSLLQTQA